MTPLGDFENPLPNTDVPCVKCGEHRLRVVEPTLLESMLVSALSPEDIAVYRSRVSVLCRGCGWAGSALRGREAA